jgi:catechol 2,3-dioxygenase-like lactoylglutathione lyase family enzyme
MRITLTSILVDDQTKALAFYTEVLGFQKKSDVPLGEHRWLTVVSPAAPDGVELVLEPDVHPAAQQFKSALMEDGIPFTSFSVDDVHHEYERLLAAGARFTQPPTPMGPVVTAVLDDTCGNLVPDHGTDHRHRLSSELSVGQSRTIRSRTGFQRAVSGERPRSSP